MDFSRVTENLEDLVLLRDRHLCRYYRGEVSMNLHRLYREVHPDLVDFAALRDLRAHELSDPARAFSNATVQALRCLEWLTLEAHTVEERQRLRERYFSKSAEASLADRIREFHANPTRDHALALVRAHDGVNPDRLAWLKSWQAILSEYCTNPEDWLKRWQGWDIALWLQHRDRALAVLVDQWHALRHQLRLPERGHWSDYWPPPEIRDHLRDLFAVPPERLISDLWNGVLNLPHPPYLDYQWVHPKSPCTPAYPRAHFDGEKYCLFLTQNVSWWRPFEILELWGRMQPAGWTPPEYPWHRLYGGDPTVLLGWGLWLQRWPFRASFWDAIDRAREFDNLAPWLRWIDLLLTLWPAVIWPWSVEIAAIPTERLDAWFRQRRTEMQEVLGWTLEAELFLAWIINRAWTFYQFRAWALSEALHAYLESFYGPRWWRHKSARFLLTDLWEAGTDPAVEDIVKDLGMPLVPL